MNSTLIILCLAIIIVALLLYIFFHNKEWYKRPWRRLQFQARRPFRGFRYYKLKKGDRLIESLLIWQNKERLKIRKFSSGLKDLSPNESVDENRAYSNALVWAVENRSVKNIALSGPYGSGKSSILKTFQKRHPEYNYLNISLASFKEKDTALNVEKVLLSILQQIFYYVKSKSMPDSRYKKIDRLSKTNRLFKSVFLIIWGLSLLLILKEKAFGIIPEWTKIYTSNTKTILSYTAIFIFLGGTLLILYYFFRLYNNSRLSKLNISSGELEIAARDQGSVLNKHLDEILYFFEIAKYNIVIIEDLDRFDTLKKTEIFTKLREINTLINNAQAIGRHVVFIYAVKDEIFIDETRTKFFDLIIPVIPVITTANSEDQLKIQFDAAGVKGLSTELLKYVAAYITDMRMLINIVNEFLVYKSTIGDFDYDPNHLLAMMLYKNLETGDYAMLQKDKGLVAEFFKNRSDYNPALLEHLELKITEAELELQKQETLFHENKKELRAVYLYELNNHLPAFASGDIYLESDLVQRKDLHEDGNFSRLMVSENVTYERKMASLGQRMASNISFRTIEEKVKPGQSYLERENILSIRLENRTEIKRKELEDLKRKKADISAHRMKEVLTLTSIEKLDKKLFEKKILCFLIEKGFIDEEYHNYLSHFYGENMSNADRNYYFSVVYKKTSSFTLKLDKIGAIIEQIDELYFLEPHVLNLNLMNYIFKNLNSYRKKAELLITQLSSNQKELTQVTKQYIDQGDQVGVFIQLLAKSWPKFWEFVDLESEYPKEVKQDYLKLLLNYAAIDDLIYQDSNKVLSNNISRIAHFNTFAQNLKNQEKLLNTLTSLNVKFEYIYPRKGKDQLFAHVKRENLYKVNRRMVSIMLSEISRVNKYDITSLNYHNYTTIINSGDADFINYIHQEIEEYIISIFLQIARNKQEKESSVIVLLNNEAITESSRFEIIYFVDTKIENITSITNQKLYIPLVNSGKITASWANITSYYDYIKEVDQNLSGFLNDEKIYKALSKQAQNPDENQEAVSLTYLNKAVILMPEISENAFPYIIKCMNEEFEELDTTGLSSVKVQHLIDNGFLGLTRSNFDKLKAHTEGKNISLLEHYHDKDEPSWINFTFDETDYYHLFKSKIFPTEDKLKIFDEMLITMISNEKVAESLAELFSTYDGILEKDKLYCILQNSKNEANRVKVLMHQINHQTKQDVPALFEAMGTPYKSINEIGGYFTLEPTIYNQALTKQIEKKFVGKIGTKDSLIKVNRLRK
jgi:hypothetical protein